MNRPAGRLAMFVLLVSLLLVGRSAARRAEAGEVARYVVLSCILALCLIGLGALALEYLHPSGGRWTVIALDSALIGVLLLAPQKRKGRP